MQTIKVVTDGETSFVVSCRTATEGEIEAFKQLRDEKRLMAMMKELYTPKDVTILEPVQHTPSYITTPSTSTPYGNILEGIKALKSQHKVYIPTSLKFDIINLIKPTTLTPYLNIAVEAGGYRVFLRACPIKDKHTDLNILQRNILSKEQTTFDFKNVPNFAEAILMGNTIFIPFA